MAPEFHPTPYGPPLSFNDFPNELGSKRKDAWAASLDTKTVLETASITKERRKAMKGESREPSGLEIAIDRDYLLSLCPKKYALTSSDLTQFELALKRVNLEDMKALLRQSSDRMQTSEGDALLYEPKTAESDIVLRSYLAASLITKFSLREINASPDRVHKNLPMLPSRLQDFVFLNGTTDPRIALSFEKERVRFSLLVFAYIIRRYAVGERIYRINQIDQAMTRLWTQLYDEGNAIKVKIFLNCLIMPFLCTLLSNEDLKLASFLNEVVQNAESMLKEIESISNEDLDVLFKSSQRTWDFGSEMSFGTLLSLYIDCDRRELQRGTTESISRYLSDSYGKKGERLISRLKRTKLHLSCMAIVDHAEKFLGIELLKRYFVDIGFITTDVLGGNKSGKEQHDFVKVNEKQNHADQQKLKGIDFSGNFYEVRDQLEATDDWNVVGDVVRRIIHDKYSGDLQTKIATSFRDSVSKIKYPSFIKSMVARGVLYLRCKETINDVPIGKWVVAVKLAFFREVPKSDLDEWLNGKINKPDALTKGKRNFDSFLRVNCHFDSVDASALVANGNYSEKERELYSTM